MPNFNKSDNRDYSDISYRNVNSQESIARSHYNLHNHQSNPSFWKNWPSLAKWNISRKNGEHHLLPTTDSPTISASTTSTNLSEFQSNSTINRGLWAHNLRMTTPEIEPLNQNKKDVQHNLNINTSIQDLESSQELCPKNADDSPRQGKLLPQLIAAIAVSWVSMVIGYASAYTSPAVITLKRDLEISDKEISWISGFMPLLAVLGGLLGGPMIECIGRKMTLVVTDVLFLIAWAINYFAQNFWYMYASRMIVGCGVGIATLTLPVYLGETVQPEVRGRLGLLPTAFGNIGILLCFLLGTILEWRGIAGVGALLPLPFFLIIWFIPETPRWYVAKKQDKNARKALEWLRGKKNQDTINKEFDDLIRTQNASNEKGDGLSDLFTRTNVKSLLIVLGLMFFQQMSGINAIIFYTTQIFKDTGSKLDPSIQTTIVGVVNFISTFIATALIDRLGRKALLYISSSSMIVTLGILGTYFYLLNSTSVDLSPYGWLPLASFVVYVLGFSLGFGPIPWLMMGEILPAKIRGPAASVATGFNWICTFVVTTTFPMFRETIGPAGIFWMFSCLTVVGLTFTALFVPETRGQSLEDIERKMAGVKVRRMSSVANLKPLQSTF